MVTLLVFAVLGMSPVLMNQQRWPEGTRAHLEALDAELIRVQRAGLVIVGNPGGLTPVEAPGEPGHRIQL